MAAVRPSSMSIGMRAAVEGHQAIVPNAWCVYLASPHSVWLLFMVLPIRPRRRRAIGIHFSRPYAA